MSFDLANLNASKNSPKGIVMRVEDANGEPIFEEVEGTEQGSDGQPLKIKRYVAITLLSQDSDEYKRVARTINNRKLEKSLRRGKVPKIRAEELEKDQLDLLVACTVSWDNITYNSKPLECTPENARLLYQNVPAVREQVDAFIGDRANFLGNS